MGFRVLQQWLPIFHCQVSPGHHNFEALINSSRLNTQNTLQTRRRQTAKTQSSNWTPATALSFAGRFPATQRKPTQLYSVRINNLLGCGADFLWRKITVAIAQLGTRQKETTLNLIRYLQFTDWSLAGGTICAAVSRLLCGFQAAASSRRKGLRENAVIQASSCRLTSTLIGLD